MICLLHGYLLEGSGSNLWTRSIVESLCRQRETVHLMAQENHPERYPFITEAKRYLPDGGVETTFRQPQQHQGCCVLHKPQLGDTLPVYVWDKYEEFGRVVPMVELPDDEVEDYLQRNVRALTRIVRENDITAIHANHAVLMSVVAQRVGEATGVPFVVMPHGSAIEYAVKRDPRFLQLATNAFKAARRIFVIGDEMRGRVQAVFGAVPDLDTKLSELHLGVDTSQFEPIPRAVRPDNIARLRDAIADLPRGKRPEQTTKLRERVAGNLTLPELQAAFAETSQYETKAPDADLEAKLEQVDWSHDPTLLFVGRLISAKGVQEVIAALPLLLEQHPDLRLLLVGHGPLREPMEALLRALETGDRELAHNIVRWGRALEGNPEGEEAAQDLPKLRLFYETLDARGELDGYFAAAQRHLRQDRVIFTGYLTHRELHLLFACCDVAVFPSVVREAGPLVFLEALASGAFPLGTYFGGMKASIDSVGQALPDEVRDAMKLDPAPERTVADIVRNVPAGLRVGPEHREELRRVAEERYDWRSVARKLASELHALSEHG